MSPTVFLSLVALCLFLASTSAQSPPLKFNLVSNSTFIQGCTGTCKCAVKSEAATGSLVMRHVNPLSSVVTGISFVTKSSGTFTGSGRVMWRSDGFGGWAFLNLTNAAGNKLDVSGSILLPPTPSGRGNLMTLKLDERQPCHDRWFDITAVKSK